MKVLFLDIDGVLNSATDFFELGKFGHPINEGSKVINRGHLALLQQIIEDTDAKIVLSTTWRLMFSDDEIYEMFVERGFSLPRESIIGRTPNLKRGMSDDHYRHRGGEIREYLKEHPEVEKYLVLDDIGEPITNPQGKYQSKDCHIKWEDRIQYEPFVELIFDGYDKLTPDMNFINTDDKCGLTVFEMNYAIHVLGLNEEAQKREDEYRKNLDLLLRCMI